MFSNSGCKNGKLDSIVTALTGLMLSQKERFESSTQTQVKFIIRLSIAKCVP